MPVIDRVILGFFTLLVIGFAGLTAILMAIHMIPFLLGVFTLIVCMLALWTIAFYVGANR